ncbi:MAG: hypothetical protein ABIK53_09615 [bacterium]
MSRTPILYTVGDERNDKSDNESSFQNPSGMDIDKEKHSIYHIANILLDESPIAF